MMPLTAALQGLCGITCGLSLSQSQSFGSTLKRDSPMHDQCLTLKIMTLYLQQKYLGEIQHNSAVLSYKLDMMISLHLQSIH